MKMQDLTRRDVIAALRICSRLDGCVHCPVLETERQSRRRCFSALQARAAELLEEWEYAEQEKPL